MRKGKLTREMILGKAAGLFNSRGYFGASMSDLMDATGLEKGGIYNHFGSKDELALAAFDYAVSINAARMKANIESHEKALDKLNAFLDTFSDIIANPTIPGGCPLLNCAVESDDAHPALREKVRGAVAGLLKSVERMITAGVKSGELKSDISPPAMATTIVAALEGAVMLVKLYDDPARMETIVSHLKSYLRSCAK